MPTPATTPLLIFDLDGTLIDSVNDLAMAVDTMLERLNTPKAGVASVRTWVGNGSLALVEQALKFAKSSADLSTAHTLFLQSYANCQDSTKAYDGVTDGLKTLNQHGYTLALCTNKPAKFLPAILAKFGWSDTFACVVAGDSLPVKKPDPAPLLYICRQLGYTPKQAIMIGDSKNDIQAGKNANITTFALSYGYNHGKPIADELPDAVFDDFGALVKALIDNVAG